MTPRPSAEAARRRTFAIISHPDAGKTTLTEKFLLYGGAVQEAGAVKARGERRRVTSDWMAMEQKRGISITSTVLQFPYRDHVLNLLDTPGHRDFSEDTYRVLAAADAAIMVLDAAKGIEPQTLKLFEVCRDRGLPLLTFLNKYDRPGRAPLELLDEIEHQIGLTPTPVTWPIGHPGDFRGVVDRRDGTFTRFTRTARRRERSAGGGRRRRARRDRRRRGMGSGARGAGVARCRRRRLRRRVVPGGDHHAGVRRFGPHQLRCALAARRRRRPGHAPTARADAEGKPRDLDAPFSGFVFKVQANMDPAHRDRIAFVRVCSGRFERGMVVTHGPTGKPFATKYAHSVFGQERETIDEAFPAMSSGW